MIRQYSFLLCSLQCSLEKKKTTWRDYIGHFYVVLGHIFIIKLKKDYIEYLNSKNFKDIHILDYMDNNIIRLQLDQSSDTFLWPKNLIYS